MESDPGVRILFNPEAEVVLTVSIIKFFPQIYCTQHSAPHLEAYWPGHEAKSLGVQGW